MGAKGDKLQCQVLLQGPNEQPYYFDFDFLDRHTCPEKQVKHETVEVLRTKTFKDWYVNDSGKYDVFLSYRQGEDLPVVQSIYNSLREACVGKDRRRPDAYLDQEGPPRAGELLAVDLIQKLSQSNVGVPVLSNHAMTRLIAGDTKCDYVLLEWWTMLLLNKGGSMQKVVPVLLDTEIGDHLLSEIPDEVHEETFKQLKENFASRTGLEAPEKVTIRSIVKDILEFKHHHWGSQQAVHQGGRPDTVDPAPACCAVIADAVTAAAEDAANRRAQSSPVARRDSIKEMIRGVEAKIDKVDKGLNEIGTKVDDLSNQLATSVSSLSDQLSKEGSATRNFMLRLQTANVPYLFDIVDDTEPELYEEAKAAANPQSPDEVVEERVGLSRGRRLLKKAKDVLKSPEDRAKKFVSDNTDKTVYLRLLCGITLEPVVTYEIEVRDEHHEKVKKYLKRSSRNMSIALKVAVGLSYVASAASLILFGALGPGTKSVKERGESAKKFVEELQASEDGLDAAQGMSEDGLDMVEMKEFAAYLEVLAGDDGPRWRERLFQVQDHTKLGGLTWTTAARAGTYGGKSHISQVKSTLETSTSTDCGTRPHLTTNAAAEANAEAARADADAASDTDSDVSL